MYWPLDIPSTILMNHVTLIHQQREQLITVLKLEVTITVASPSRLFQAVTLVTCILHILEIVLCDWKFRRFSYLLQENAGPAPQFRPLRLISSKSFAIYYWLNTLTPDAVQSQLTIPLNKPPKNDKIHNYNNFCGLIWKPKSRNSVVILSQRSKPFL